MKIVSYNVNGLVYHFKQIEELSKLADVICLQETKCDKAPELEGFMVLLDPSTDRPCLDGTAIYWKNDLTVVANGHSAGEGRFSMIRIKDLTIMNVYAPSAGENLRFMDNKLRFLQQLPSVGEKVIYCGDFNVALTNDDIAAVNKKQAEKNKGFTPVERGAFETMVYRLKLTDVYRKFFPTQVGYTYNNVRFKNTKKRIDYFLADEKALPLIRGIGIIGSEDKPDHRPLIVSLLNV